MNYFEMKEAILDYASTDEADREQITWKLMTLSLSHVIMIYKMVCESSKSSEEVNAEIFALA